MVNPPYPYLTPIVALADFYSVVVDLLSVKYRLVACAGIEVGPGLGGSRNESS